MIPRKLKENLIKSIFLALSITAIVTLAGIAFFLFKEAVPTFTKEYATSIHTYVPVVHRDNQIWKKSIRRDKLKTVFTGEITNWKDLGGEPNEIQVVSYSETTPEGRKWFDRLMKGASLPANAIKVESAREMNKAIIRNKENAIGFLDREEIGRGIKEFIYTRFSAALENDS